MCDIKSHKIKIFGIGGAGCTNVNLLLEKPVKGVDYYVVDSDKEVLRLSDCPNKIEVTSEFSCDNNSCSKSVQDTFKETIPNTDIIIIISGLDGYVGSSFTAVLAGVAHEMGIKAVAIVTTPFEFEGKRRMAKSVECLEKLKSVSSTVIVMPNHRIKKMVQGSTPMSIVMSISNTVILEAVDCIVSPICEPGYLPINYDDFISVLRDGELSCISVGAGDGENAIQDAIQSTIHNPLSLTKMSVLNNVLLSITCGTDMDVPDILTIGDDIRDTVAPNANIELAAKRLPNWNNKVRIGLIGFVDEKKQISNPKIKLHMSRFENKFNDELNCVLAKAEELAKKFETNYIASEHLVYAMLLTDCKAGEILNECGCNKEVFERFFVKSIYSSSAIIGYTPRTKMIIQNAKDNMILKKGSEVPIGTEHVLYSILSADSLARKILIAMNLGMKHLNELLDKAINS